MKSRFALLAMMVIAAAPLAAQGGGGGGGGMGGMGGGGRGGRGIMNDSTMASLLGLSADQHTKYKATLDAYNTANMSLMTYMRAQRTAQADVSPDSTAKQTAMRAKVTADLKALLTADQAKLFDSVVTATPAGGGRRGGGGGGI
jgi:Spy/CpxP family protein refolding chaperone